LGDFEEQTDEAAPLGDLPKAGFRTIRFGTAVRVRRAAEAISGRSREDAVGRSQEAERDNDGFVLNRLRNVYKHRRLPLLAATLAREGGR
jgi:hypothetical protein